MLDYILIRVLLIALAGWLVACDLSLTREETAVIPVSDGPTVTALLCPQDTVHRVRLRYTVPAIGSADEARFREELKKTTVQLRQGGHSATLAFDSIHQVFSVRAKLFSFKEGETLSLAVQMPGRPLVQATCTIPANKVDSSSIHLEKLATPSGDVLYRFRWRDIPGEGNFYAFWILRTSYDSRTGAYSVQQELARLPLNDQNLIDGEVVTDLFSFNLPRRNAPNGSYEQSEILVCNTDEAYYTYHRLLGQIQRDPSPFTEPVRLPSNIEGGYSVMAGYNRIRIILE